MPAPSGAALRRDADVAATAVASTPGVSGAGSVRVGTLGASGAGLVRVGTAVASGAGSVCVGTSGASGAGSAHVGTPGASGAGLVVAGTYGPCGYARCLGRGLAAVSVVTEPCSCQLRARRYNRITGVARRLPETAAFLSGGAAAARRRRGRVWSGAAIVGGAGDPSLDAGAAQPATAA